MTLTHAHSTGNGCSTTASAEQMLELLVDRARFTPDEAYSLASVAVDLGVTQVVDGVVGCHAAVPSIAPNLLGL